MLCRGVLSPDGSAANSWTKNTDAASRPFVSCPQPRQPWRVAAPSPPSLHPRATAQADVPAATLPEQLRAVMRLVPHSVVVCTSVFTPPASTTTAAAAPEPRGMTMSSFTSLTLHPAPVVTFNVATPSRTLDAVAASRAFTIHVLRGDAEGARVAEWFRRGNAAGLGVFDPIGMREGCGCEVVVGGGGSRCWGAEQEEKKRRPQEEDNSRQGAGGGNEVATLPPLLRGRGVLYALRCKVLDDDGPTGGLVRVRDHVVVLAEVVEIVEGLESAAAGEETFGLTYADRKYRQLGGTMVNEG